MEVDNKFRICRCCSNEGMFKDLKTQYKWMDQEEVYSDILKECFNVEVSL